VTVIAASGTPSTPDGPTLGNSASDTVMVTGLLLGGNSTLTGTWYAQYGVAPQYGDGTCE
jgi:hypothetical protein